MDEYVGKRLLNSLRHGCATYDEFKWADKLTIDGMVKINKGNHMKKQIYPLEKNVSPEKAFKNLVNGIIKPENEIIPYYSSENSIIFNLDCLEVLPRIKDNSVDMIFADPPYMLSNNGFTCQNGRMVNVNKGKWDKSNGFEEDTKFHDTWINACRKILKPEGTIWISGTY